MVERRSRMKVCMELIKAHSSRNDAEVRLYVQQLSDRLSEQDARNYLFHSLLVNCYHAVEQREVEQFGAVQMPEARLRKVLDRPADKPRLRLSLRQKDVLNTLLREDGAGSKEVQFFGWRLTELTVERQAAVICFAVIFGVG